MLAPKIFPDSVLSVDSRTRQTDGNESSETGDFVVVTVAFFRFEVQVDPRNQTIVFTAILVSLCVHSRAAMSSSSRGGE